MDQSFIESCRRLGKSRNLFLKVSRWVPTGYAPVLLRLMGVPIDRVVLNPQYDPPGLVKNLFKCDYWCGEDGVGMRFKGNACSLTQFTMRTNDDFLVRFLQPKS